MRIYVSFIKTINLKILHFMYFKKINFSDIFINKLIIYANSNFD